MNFAYSNVTLRALRARQCDGHTTRNSFNVELNFCLVGICMELSVQSVHFRVARSLSPPVWQKNLSSGPKPEYFKGGVAYIYIYRYIRIRLLGRGCLANRFPRLGAPSLSQRPVLVRWGAEASIPCAENVGASRTGRKGPEACSAL